LLADFAETRINRRVVIVAGLAVQHAARSKPGEEIWEVRSLRVVRQFRLFGGVQVIKRAVELVEPMDSRQVFIAITEVVLAELSSGVALTLEQLGDGHIADVAASPTGRKPGRSHAGDAGSGCIGGDRAGGGASPRSRAAGEAGIRRR